MADPQLIFEKYRLVKRIAIGGMGEIFEANHGKGSWKKFLKEWNAIHQEGGETEVEYMEYMSDLSSISITK